MAVYVCIKRIRVNIYVYVCMYYVYILACMYILSNNFKSFPDAVARTAWTSAPIVFRNVLKMSLICGTLGALYYSYAKLVCTVPLYACMHACMYVCMYTKTYLLTRNIMGYI